MASYTLTVYVEDIDSVIASYNQVRIYRSITGAVANRSLYSSFSLVAGQSTYEWTDTSGESTYVAWFTYFNSSSLAESDYSASIQYEDSADDYVPGFSFSGRTYPLEFSLSYDERRVVDDIRVYIGDPKGVKRDYVSPSSSDGYENVSDDETTYKLADPPGWPLKVNLDSQAYTSLTEPTVNNYELVTFSGTTISTTSGILDIWYESFRFSDREILKIYRNAPEPPYLTTSTTTEEIYKVSTAILIIESEISKLMGETSGSVNLQGELSFNPEPLLRQKRGYVDGLKKKLKEMVDEITSSSISGVRVD